MRIWKENWKKKTGKNTWLGKNKNRRYMCIKMDKRSNFKQKQKEYSKQQRGSSAEISYEMV